jgi:hypothetical protein
MGRKAMRRARQPTAAVPPPKKKKKKACTHRMEVRVIPRPTPIEPPNLKPANSAATSARGRCNNEPPGCRAAHTLARTRCAAPASVASSTAFDCGCESVAFAVGGKHSQQTLVVVESVFFAVGGKHSQQTPN